MKVPVKTASTIVISVKTPQVATFALLGMKLKVVLASKEQIVISHVGPAILHTLTFVSPVNNQRTAFFRIRLVEHVHRLN